MITPLVPGDDETEYFIGNTFQLLFTINMSLQDTHLLLCIWDAILIAMIELYRTTTTVLQTLHTTNAFNIVAVITSAMRRCRMGKNVIAVAMG